MSSRWTSSVTKIKPHHHMIVSKRKNSDYPKQMGGLISRVSRTNRINEKLGMTSKTQGHYWSSRNLSQSPVPQVLYFPQGSATAAIYLILKFAYIFVPPVWESVSQEQVSNWLSKRWPTEGIEGGWTGRLCPPWWEHWQETEMALALLLRPRTMGTYWLGQY